MNSNDFKPKSFWERPEGTTGMVAIGLGVLGLGFAAPALLGIFNNLIALLGAGITITILGAILFALVMILTNKKFQTLMSYLFKSAMRKITGAFVEIDPIGIMKSYIEELKAKRETMDVSIGKLNGQVKVCQNQIDKNQDELGKQMATFKVANDQGLKSAATVASRQAGRLDKLNKSALLPLLRQMEVHLKALQKYKEVTGTVIDDLENEVKAQEMQRKMITESHGAMMTAKRILQGGTDQKELFDRAMEYVVQDYGMKIGEIENFIESSKGFVESLDIQNGVYEEEALNRLKEWENKADSILLGNQKQQILEQRYDSSIINTGVGVPAAGSSDDYSHLIGRKR